MTLYNFLIKMSRLLFAILFYSTGGSICFGRWEITIGEPQKKKKKKQIIFYFITNIILMYNA